MNCPVMQVKEPTTRYVANAGAQSVPPGCEWTGVGMIARGWEIVPLRKISDFITKGSTPTTYGFKWEDVGILFLRSECVSPDGLDLDQSMFISRAANEMLRRSEVRDGDLLITITGNVGRVVSVRGVGMANINQHIARIRISSRSADPNYVYYFLSRKTVRRRFESITTGQAYPQISLQQVREAEVPLPTLPEQRAIVDALSDVDGLLAALHVLIAKKRAIKQATMQQLLTGKTRLPGFTDEWETKRLGEIAQLKNGYAFKSETYDPIGNFKVITIANVQDGYMQSADCNRISVPPSDIQQHQKLRLHDILISMTGNVGRVCRVSETRCLLNQRVGKLVARKIDSDFLFALLSQRQFLSAMETKAKGGAQGNLGVSDIMGFEFFVPSSKAEQTAIAGILSDVDAEIVLLEARRNKTRSIKQGMMQQLLTGRIRLVKPQPVEAET